MSARRTSKHPLHTHTHARNDSAVNLSDACTKLDGCRVKNGRGKTLLKGKKRKWKNAIKRFVGGFHAHDERLSQKTEDEGK